MLGFGQIKNIFNNLLIEGVGKKNDTSRDLFKRYIRVIKESEILKNQFLVYTNIENKTETDIQSASLYVSESVRLLEKYSTDDILKENKKLTRLLNGGGVKVVSERLGLHEALDNLILTKRTPKNIESITENIKIVAKYITENKDKEAIEIMEDISLPISVLRNIMVEKYNDKYGELDSFDKDVLRVLIDSNIEEKERFYGGVVAECKVLVDNLLMECDDESRIKLTKVRNKLDEDTKIMDENDFIFKISKLAELKTNLKNG